MFHTYSQPKTNYIRASHRRLYMEHIVKSRLPAADSYRDNETLSQLHLLDLYFFGVYTERQGKWQDPADFTLETIPKTTPEQREAAIKDAVAAIKDEVAEYPIAALMDKGTIQAGLLSIALELPDPAIFLGRFLLDRIVTDGKLINGHAYDVARDFVELAGRGLWRPVHRIAGQLSFSAWPEDDISLSMLWQQAFRQNNFREFDWIIHQFHQGSATDKSAWLLDAYLLGTAAMVQHVKDVLHLDGYILENAPKFYGTVFTELIRINRISVFPTIIEPNAVLNALVNVHIENILYVLLEHGNWHMLQWLLQTRTDLTIHTARQHSVFSWKFAAYSGNVDCLKWLQRTLNQAEDDDQLRMFYAAIMNNHANMFLHLVQSYEAFTFPNREIWHYAITKGLSKMLVLMHETMGFVLVERDDWIQIDKALKTGLIDGFDEIDGAAYVQISNKKGRNVLIIALEDVTNKSLLWLLRNGANASFNNYDWFTGSAGRWSWRFLQQIMDILQARGELKQALLAEPSAMYYAVAAKRHLNVDILLKYGAPQQLNDAAKAWINAEIGE